LRIDLRKGFRAFAKQPMRSNQVLLGIFSEYPDEINV
jgi:hypothetical protein